MLLNPPLQRPLTASRGRFWPATILGLVLLLAWEASGLDLPMARWFGDASGFAWRENWFVVDVLHNAAQRLGWIWLLGMALAVFWPVGVLRALNRGERAGMVGGTLLALLVIIWMKLASHTSCPWDLAAFGGVARYQSHWLGWLQDDGGAGRCFPAGHASAGFAFVAGWFALRRDLPRLAAVWLAVALFAGLVLGLAQQLRGAHFMSHTLWTAWLCAAVGWAVDAAFARSRADLQGAAA